MANEAGQGASNRSTSISKYTFWSAATASISGQCTRFAFYGNCTSPSTARMAFFSASGTQMTRETSVIEVSVGTGEKVHEFSSPGDFTAFDVTAGWWLGVYFDQRIAISTSGGVGANYAPGDQITPAENNAVSGANFLDALEADITVAGSIVPVVCCLHRLRRN